jgi:hypothetical protein
MYLRVTITQIDELSKRPKGLFTAAYSLLRSGYLTQEEHQRLKEILDW